MFSNVIFLKAHQIAVIYPWVTCTECYPHALKALHCLLPWAMVSPRLGRHEGAIRWGCSRGQSRQAFDHPSPGVPVPSSQISSTLRALLCFSRLVSFNQVKQSLYIYLILEIIGEDRSKSRWQSKIYLNCFTGGCQYLQSFVIFGNTIAGSTSHGCRVFSFDLDSSSWGCEWDHITDGSRERVWLYQASITRERQSWDEDTGCFPPAGVIDQRNIVRL